MIRYKNPEQIALLREGGQKLGRITAQLAAAVRPGITTADLEELLLQLITEAGGERRLLRVINLVTAAEPFQPLCALLLINKLFTVQPHQAEF
jgi:Xaa-Pro aminopeptidase